MKNQKGATSRRGWFWVVLLVMLWVAAGCAAPLIRPEAGPAAGSQTTSDVTRDKAAAPTNTETTAAQAAPAASQALPSDESYKEIPVGFTTEGFPYRGSPDAPIVIYEFSDYQCPFCSRYFVQTEPAINESFVRTGQVRVVFRDFPLAQLHPNAPAAHVAALCIAEQGSAATFWSMHDQLFSTQTIWSNLSDPAPHLTQLAEGLGVDMTRFQDCIASGVKQAVVEQGLADGQQLGISGTPSFSFVRLATSENFLLVGAQPYDQFAGMIDALIAGETPAQAQQPQPEQQGEGEIPFWATAEGLKPDAAKPGYTVAGDEYRGNPEAKVVVIEFSDFQCPYCRRHVEATQPILDQAFVETDKVLWVFKHFPLSIHPQAQAAGVASECAADQGQFWEMHELLFTTVDQWSVSDPSAVFNQLASQLALDAEQFATCLADDGVAQRVQSDLQEGAAFVQGTPTFVVLFNGEGRLIPGALPAERFQQALQQVLDTVGE